MSSYTVEQLRRRGPRYAFALLLQHVASGEEPFVTYGAIARHLEEKLGIARVFPTHIGAVAGALMDRILEEDPGAPLINGLITRPSGIPGRGFGGYYDGAIRRAGGRRWSALGRSRRIEELEKVRSAVRRYPGWEQLYRRLFGSAPAKAQRRKTYRERDGKPPETSFPRNGGESPEHRRLKDWAAANPQALGLSRSMTGEAESDQLSGDRVDVQFTDGKAFVVCEVKSILSGEADWQRGLYQCVKYRAVRQAQELPAEPDVRAILLTERALPPELQERARALGVTLKVKKLNQRRKARAG